jgi:hypothetical protein
MAAVSSYLIAYISSDSALFIQMYFLPPSVSSAVPAVDYAGNAADYFMYLFNNDKDIKRARE